MNLDIEIEHQPEQLRFIVEIDAQESRLEYQLKPGNVIDFTHTFVPPALRGHGIAEKLVRGGLAWAREQGFEIQAGCWYVRLFLRDQRDAD